MNAVHSLNFTEYGDSADDIEQAARKRCDNYFGRGVGYKLSIWTTMMARNMAGTAEYFEANVQAERT